MAERQDSHCTYTRCHVFIDDSNLWIEGQRYAARKLKLRDIGHDPRFRVDLGRFLDLVVGKRALDAALLYGSRPPPNDSVWNAARKRNFEVKTFERAQGVPYGREKEVDVAMGVAITRHAYDCDEGEKDNTVFIIVTGDRDFTTAVECPLEKGIRVELWAWKTNMSTEFRRLARKEELLTVREIEHIADDFAFTSYQATRVIGDVDPAHAIVFKDIPNNKKFVERLATDLLRLLRIFYIIRLPPSMHSDELQDIAVEFPKAKPEDILKQVERLGFHYKAYGYAMYISDRSLAQHQLLQTRVRSQYQTLSDLDTSDLESTAEAITSSLNVNIEEVFPQEEPSATQAPETDPEESETADKDDDDSSEWIVVVRRKAGAWTHRRKLKQIRCRWGIHCTRSSTCKFHHTDEEKELFELYPRLNFKYWKTKECTRKTPHSREQCRYWHSSSDTWCLLCRSWDHSIDDHPPDEYAP